MNELSVTQDSRTYLDHNPNLTVQRHQEPFTTGTPDMSITGYGRTLWVEDKYLESDELLGFIGARSLVKKKRVPQMNTLRSLCKNGLAQYWLYQNVNGFVFVGWLHPMEVFEAYQVKGKVEIRNIMSKTEWLSLVPSLLRER